MRVTKGRDWWWVADRDTGEIFEGHRFWNGAVTTALTMLRDPEFKAYVVENARIELSADPYQGRSRDRWVPRWDRRGSDMFDQAVIEGGKSKCTRRKIGAVLVKEDRVIGRGYNGMVDDCPRDRLSYRELPAYAEYSNCPAPHAEMVAIHDALRNEEPVAGGTVYVTARPCDDCQAALDWHGIGVRHL